MRKPEGIWSFFRAFVAEWFTAMSGALAVLLSVAAYFVQNDPARLALAMTAIACFVFASYRVWRTECVRIIALEIQLKAMQADLAQLTILKVSFDANGPTEFYVDYRISNPSSPTTIRAWQLLIAAPRLGSTPICVVPQHISTGRLLQDYRGAILVDDMATTPIEQGGIREGRLTFSFSKSAKDTIGECDAIFELSADDIKGHKIRTAYSCAIIPTT
jgi:hypothetical protein